MGRVQGWVVGVVGLLRHPSRESLKLLVPLALDATSGALFKDLAQHKLISEMEVIVAHVSGKQLTQVASYTLGNVVITNIQNTGKSGTGAERVSGTFSSLKGTVGSGKDSVPTTWNRVTNEPTLTPSTP